MQPWLFDIGPPIQLALGFDDFLLDHDVAIAIMGSAVEFTIWLFNSLPWKITMLLRTVNHLFLWAIEKPWLCGYGSIPIHTIFNGMNIHLPAILMFTRGTRFWPIPMFVITGCSMFSPRSTPVIASGHLQHGGRRRDRITDRGQSGGNLGTFDPSLKEHLGNRTKSWTVGQKKPEQPPYPPWHSMTFRPKLHSFGLLVWEGVCYVALSPHFKLCLPGACLAAGDKDPPGTMARVPRMN